MLRSPFDQQQRLLQDKVLVLGSRVEELLQQAVETLRVRHQEQAGSLLEGARRLQQSRAGIETDTMALLSTQQPMAGDLRFLAAVFQITSELGAIIDHTREIIEATLTLEDRPHPEPFVSVIHMAGAVTKMIRQALEAFSERDILLAQAIAVQDDAIDELYAYLTRRLMAVTKSDVTLATYSIQVAHIAHNLERVGDRATNMCEWVIYAVTGYIVEMNVQLDLDKWIEADLSPVKPEF